MTEYKTQEVVRYAQERLYIEFLNSFWYSLGMSLQYIQKQHSLNLTQKDNLLIYSVDTVEFHLSEHNSLRVYKNNELIFELLKGSYTEHYKDWFYAISNTYSKGNCVSLICKDTNVQNIHDYLKFLLQ